VLVGVWAVHDGRFEMNTPGDGSHFAGLIFEELELLLDRLGCWLAPPAPPAPAACGAADEAATRDWLRPYGDVEQTKGNGSPLPA
jgi:hypothetical protein